MSREPSAWLLAIRPRTLPLACSSILLGAGLAARRDAFDPAILGLALLTAVLLQVLSNLANDYGDAMSGIDDEARIGPRRAVGSGLIAPRAMRGAVVATSLAAAISGLMLLYVSFGTDWLRVVSFIALGGAAIVAAITYTVGVGGAPYGYRGLGDLSVFVFFGLVGVLGSYYLFTHEMSWMPLLPATASGLLATAVLNVNNVRDIESDAASGKITLAVRLGRRRAVAYQWGLLLAALSLSLAFLLMQERAPWAWLCLLSVKPLGEAAWTLHGSRDGAVLNAMLKKTVIGAFLYGALLSIGLPLS